jgi:hypothetical protein
MKELDVIDLPDRRRGTIVHIHPNARMIIVEVGPGLIDISIEENGLKEISCMTVGPDDQVNHLIEDKKAAN